MAELIKDYKLPHVYVCAFLLLCTSIDNFLIKHDYESETKKALGQIETSHDYNSRYYFYRQSPLQFLVSNLFDKDSRLNVYV